MSVIKKQSKLGIIISAIVAVLSAVIIVMLSLYLSGAITKKVDDPPLLEPTPPIEVVNKMKFHKFANEVGYLESHGYYSEEYTIRHINDSNFDKDFRYTIMNNTNAPFDVYFYFGNLLPGISDYANVSLVYYLDYNAVEHRVRLDDKGTCKIQYSASINSTIEIVYFLLNDIRFYPISIMHDNNLTKTLKTLLCEFIYEDGSVYQGFADYAYMDLLRYGYDIKLSPYDNLGKFPDNTYYDYQKTTNNLVDYSGLAPGYIDVDYSIFSKVKKPLIYNSFLMTAIRVQNGTDSVRLYLGNMFADMQYQYCTVGVLNEDKRVYNRYQLDKDGCINVPVSNLSKNDVQHENVDYFRYTIRIALPMVNDKPYLFRHMALFLNESDGLLHMFVRNYVVNGNNCYGVLSTNASEYNKFCIANNITKEVVYV